MWYSIRYGVDKYEDLALTLMAGEGSKLTSLQQLALIYAILIIRIASAISLISVVMGR